jgi:L-seryl-tRNA(Ser) seleniumtransferase
MKGFTEEVSISQLQELARSRGIPVIYDLGSGLIRKPASTALQGEPDVASAIADGADIITFSCDKLLGGPQAGIIAGKKRLISQIAIAPLMRTLRVDKLTYAALSAVCRHYLNEKSLIVENPIFAFLERSPEELSLMASELVKALAKEGITATAVPSKGACGGGTLPDLEVTSVAVHVATDGMSSPGEPITAEALFYQLLKLDHPVLGILREGKLLFDLLAVFDDEIGAIAAGIAAAMQAVSGSIRDCGTTTVDSGGID